MGPNQNEIPSGGQERRGPVGATGVTPEAGGEGHRLDDETIDLPIKLPYIDEVEDTLRRMYARAHLYEK